MSTRQRCAKGVGAGVLAAGLLAAAYPVMLRERCLGWGATAEEVRREMPGDELLWRSDVCSTRAVTVVAPPAAIWPWLVQIGGGRGGAFTYDWIESLLGLTTHRAGKLGEKCPRLRTVVFEPERALVSRAEDGTWVWALALYPQGRVTRLVSRNRFAVRDASLVGRLANLLMMEPGSLAMERRMLLGIKQRAERLAGHAAAPARIGVPPAARTAL